MRGDNGMDLADIVLGLVEIAVFPGVTFALGWGIAKIRDWKKFRVFCKVFGRVAEKQENLIISLPLWRVKDCSRDDTRFQKLRLDGKYEEYYGPDETISWDDLKAGAQIASIIAEVYSRPVSYSLDNDRDLDIIGKSLIMIGSPLANIRARGILELVQQPYLEYVDQEETEEHPARTAIRDKRENTLYDSSGDWEYSLILRVPNYRTEGGYFFLVSGPHAEGTLAAATYLKNNWEEFENADPVAGILLKMPRGDITLHGVLKRFGFSQY